MTAKAFTLTALMALLVLGPVSVDVFGMEPDPRARLKRLAIIVPDLDRADTFFTEVLRFTQASEGLIDPSSDPYLGVVFEGLPARPLRNALYDTATEKRGLFVLEVPEFDGQADSTRQVLTVVESSDLDALRERARRLGFATAFPVSDRSPEGLVFKEVLVTGPGGHAFLVYQFGAHDDEPTGSN